MEQGSILQTVLLQGLVVLVLVEYGLLDRAQTSSSLPFLLDPARHASEHPDPQQKNSSETCQGVNVSLLSGPDRDETWSELHILRHQQVFAS